MTHHGSILVEYYISMHEISIVRNILEITKSNIPAGSEKYVKEIRLKIGLAAGIVTDSLEFCFTALTQDTPLQQSRLIIEEVPVMLECKVCQKVHTREDLYFICPVCGSNSFTVISGTELEVSTIELTEEEETLP